MEKIVFALPGNEVLAKSVCSKTQSEMGESLIRRFPDGEVYVKVNSDVKGKKVILVCSLNQPDTTLLPLYFLSKTVKDMGAVSVSIIAPYLAYMRQDKRFNPGEGITSTYFASLLSGFVDDLITVDPHLHRRSLLAEIYNVPTKVLHAAGVISNWIKSNVHQPLLIGPDSESEQWVSEIGSYIGAPFVVLEKRRKGDREVEISVPSLEKYREHTPVLIDDIISTGRTMIEAIKHLKKAEMKAPVCIGVHAVFAENAYYDLILSGAGRVITCNTIPHISNKIYVDDLLVNVLK